MRMKEIPQATVARLSLYSRFLAQAQKNGITTVSSEEIARGVGVSAAMVRKDLSFVGTFGIRGVGYNVRELHRYLLKILGLTAPWPTIIVGAGKLGSALAAYDGFRERGFQIRAIFDIDPEKVGHKLNGIEIYSLDRLSEIIKATKASIAIICVPANRAQSVADDLVRAGIRGILNFAPSPLVVPPEVVLCHADLLMNLELLSFRLSLGRKAFQTNAC